MFSPNQIVPQQNTSTNAQPVTLNIAVPANEMKQNDLETGQQSKSPPENPAVMNPQKQKKQNLNETEKFILASTGFTYVLGLCALNAFLGIFLLIPIISMLNTPGITYASSMNSFLAMIFIAYFMLIFAFIIFMVARKLINLQLILLSLIFIMLSSVFWLIALCIDLQVISFIAAFLPQESANLISMWFVWFFSAIFYYGFLASLGARVAIYLALEMNKPNFVATQLLKFKKFQPKENPH